MKVRRPAKVVVGYQTVSIEEATISEMDDAVGRYYNGCVAPANGHRILIANNIKGIERANTVIHEVLHACWRVGALNTAQQLHDEEDDGRYLMEEHVVNTLANVLTQVIRDNQGLVSWLQQECK